MQRARAHRARNSAQLAAQFSDTPPLRARVHARLSASSRCTRSPTPISSARMDTPHELHLLVYPPSLTLTHLPGIARTSTGFWQEQADASLPPLAAELERFLQTRPAARLPQLWFDAGAPRKFRRAFGARNSDASTLHQVYSRAGWAADCSPRSAHCAGSARARDQQARAETCSGVARRAHRTVGVARRGVPAVRVRDSPRRRGHRRRRRPCARAVACGAAPHVDRSGAMGQVDSRPRCRCVDGRHARSAADFTAASMPSSTTGGRRRRRRAADARRRRRRRPRHTSHRRRAQGGGGGTGGVSSAAAPSRGGGGAVQRRRAEHVELVEIARGAGRRRVH